MSCSFCGSFSHNITTCLDPEIDALYDRMKNMYISKSHFVTNRERIDSLFKYELSSRFILRDIKAVSVVWLGENASKTKPYYIYKLCEHFKAIVQIEENELPSVPDSIPEFATDLEIPTSPTSVSLHEQVEPDITWYIDTTPEITEIYRRHLITSSHINLMADFNEDVSSRVRNKPNIIPILEQNTEQSTEEHECSICLDTYSKECCVSLNCHHEFCQNCISYQIKSNQTNNTCALCREPIVSIVTKKQEIYDSFKNLCN